MVIQAQSPSNPFMRGVDISRRQRIQEKQIESDLTLERLAARKQRAELKEWHANEPVREVEREVAKLKGLQDLEFSRRERIARLEGAESQTAQRRAMTAGQRLENEDMRMSRAARQEQYDATEQTHAQQTALNIREQAEQVRGARQERRLEAASHRMEVQEYVQDRIPQQIGSMNASDYRRFRKDLTGLGVDPSRDMGLPVEFNDQAKLRLRNLSRQARYDTEAATEVEQNVRQAEAMADRRLQDEFDRKNRRAEQLRERLEEDPDDQEAARELSNIQRWIDKEVAITGRTEHDMDVLDETRLNPVQTEMMFLREENQVINELIATIDNNPTSVGITGSIRQGMQTARGIASDVSGDFDNPIANFTNELVSGFERNVSTDYRNGNIEEEVFNSYFDPDVADVSYWNNMLAYIHARSLMKPNDRLNAQDIENAKDSLGLRGFRSADRVKAQLLQAQRQLNRRYESLKTLREPARAFDELSGDLETYNPNTRGERPEGRDERQPDVRWSPDTGWEEVR